MAGGLHYRPHFFRDWAASSTVRRMDMAKRGVYHELLDVQWDDGYLPSAPLECAQILGLSKTQWVAIGFPLDKCFPRCEDGNRRNPRCAELRAQAMQKVEVNRKNGAKGGRPVSETLPSNQVQKEPTGLILGNPNGTQTKPIPETYTENTDANASCEAEPHDTAAWVLDNILSHLNEKTGRKFTVKGGGAKHIRARVRECGKNECKLCDVESHAKLIVDHKVAEWLSDAHMKAYLRPETLFSPTHWESYLEAAYDWEEAGCQPIVRNHTNGQPRKGRETIEETRARLEREMNHA